MNLLHVCIGNSGTPLVWPLNWSQFFHFDMFCQKVHVSEVCAPIGLAPSPPPPQQETLDSPLTIVE